MATSTQHRIREWVEIAISRGWTVVPENKGSHLKFYRPDGTFATSLAGSPRGDRRTILNMRAKLRRAGLHGIR